MPIQSGAYVNPGWVNGTTPAINATEMNAISDTLETVPIVNGGTGATTVAGARNNLGLGNTSGALPIANGGTGGTTAAEARNNLGLGNTNGALPLANGGTGATSAADARNNLGLGNTTGALPIANGGTGATSVASARNALGLGNTSGALPIANGGTGETSVAGIRSALGIVDYVIEEALGVTTNISPRIQQGVISWRKWASGALEIWGWGRQIGNMTFSTSSWFGGYEAAMSGGTAYDGERRFEIWGQYPVTFLEAPAVTIEYIGEDQSTDWHDFIILRTPQEINGNNARDMTKYPPNVKALRGGVSGVVIGHPQFSFYAIGRWSS